MFRDYDYRWLSKLFVEWGWLPERQGVIFAIFQLFRDQDWCSPRNLQILELQLGLPRKSHTFRDSRIPVSHSTN